MLFISYQNLYLLGWWVDGFWPARTLALTAPGGHHIPIALKAQPMFVLNVVTERAQFSAGEL